MRLVILIWYNELVGKWLLGVKEVFGEEEVNMNILNVLVKLFNEDTNVNVWMVVLEGLKWFYDEFFVRKLFIEFFNK